MAKGKMCLKFTQRLAISPSCRSIAPSGWKYLQLAITLISDMDTLFNLSHTPYLPADVGKV